MMPFDSDFAKNGHYRLTDQRHDHCKQDVYEHIAEVPTDGSYDSDTCCKKNVFGKLVGVSFRIFHNYLINCLKWSLLFQRLLV